MGYSVDKKVQQHPKYQNHCVPVKLN